MCHSFLRHHVQKKILVKRNMYRTDIERTCLNKLTKLISSDMEKKFSKFLSDDCQKQPREVFCKKRCS